MVDFPLPCLINGFNHRLIHGPFSSTPCLITGGYILHFLLIESQNKSQKSQLSPLHQLPSPPPRYTSAFPGSRAYQICQGPRWEEKNPRHSMPGWENMGKHVVQQQKHPWTFYIGLTYLFKLHVCNYQQRTVDMDISTRFLTIPSRSIQTKTCYFHSLLRNSWIALLLAECHVPVLGLAVPGERCFWPGTVVRILSAVIMCI